MFEGAEWDWGHDWLTSLAGCPLLGARPTQVADALLQVDPFALLEADEAVAEEAITTLQQALNQISALQQVFIEAFARAKDREWQVGPPRSTTGCRPGAVRSTTVDAGPSRRPASCEKSPSPRRSLRSSPP